MLKSLNRLEVISWRLIINIIKTDSYITNSQQRLYARCEFYFKQILAGGVGVLRKGSQGTLYAGKVKAFGVPRLLAISSPVCIY